MRDREDGQKRCPIEIGGAPGACRTSSLASDVRRAGFGAGIHPHLERLRSGVGSWPCLQLDFSLRRCGSGRAAARGRGGGFREFSSKPAEGRYPGDLGVESFLPKKENKQWRKVLTKPN